MGQTFMGGKEEAGRAGQAFRRGTPLHVQSQASTCPSPKQPLHAPLILRKKIFNNMKWQGTARASHIPAAIILVLTPMMEYIVLRQWAAARHGRLYHTGATPSLWISLKDRRAPCGTASDAAALYYLHAAPYLPHAPAATPAFGPANPGFSPIERHVISHVVVGETAALTLPQHLPPPLPGHLPLPLLTTCFAGSDWCGRRRLLPRCIFKHCATCLVSFDRCTALPSARDLGNATRFLSARLRCLRSFSTVCTLHCRRVH